MDLRPGELDLLCSCALFEGLPAHTVEDWAKRPDCLRTEYRRAEIIYDKSHVQRRLGILLRGTVQVHKSTDDGRGLLISRLQPGSLFGAAALFHTQSGYVTILTAAEPCSAAFFSQELLLQLMRQEFSVAENYIRYLSGRILFLNAKIAQLSAGTAELRVARFLQQNAGADESGELWAQPGSITALASRLNLGRASVYRALDALERQGVIRREKSRILILDPGSVPETEA